MTTEQRIEALEARLEAIEQGMATLSAHIDSWMSGAAASIEQAGTSIAALQTGDITLGRLAILNSRGQVALELTTNRDGVGVLTLHDPEERASKTMTA